MSGIVGILHLSGAPIDRTLLAQLTNSLIFRGPDAQRMWCRGQIGFGHTLLQSAIESKDEHQPFSLDGNAWIVADARVDGRRDLIAKLQVHCDEGLDGIPDAELILRGYQIWGEQCIDHLIGDFAFAIWNSRTRRLFCARDHFGIKPFFYAHIGNALIFGNTLDCLRLHPAVSGRLNDLAIADFLLFDSNQDLGTTAFADILRLPPAHTLQCQDGTVTVRRYWRLPEATTSPNSGRSRECVDHFREVFDAAVSDRLRGDSAGILLTSGLDSPSVAASARRVLNRRNSAFDFRAYGIVQDRQAAHEERHNAELVAKALNLPIYFSQAGNRRLFEDYADPGHCTPEPAHFPLGHGYAFPRVDIEEFSRTALTGCGGSPAMGCLLSTHFRGLFQKRMFGRMFADAAGYLGAQGRFSRLYLRTRLQRWLGEKRDGLQFHPWLNPDFVKRLSLRERWETMLAETETNRNIRPDAYSSVASRKWTLTLESFDPGSVGFRVESCHPFFDLRVLDFLLALPALPWCSDQELLRQAGRGVLPDAVRLRGESSLSEDPIVALLQKPEAAWIDRFEAVSELQEYVQRDHIPRTFQTSNSAAAWANLKPLSLDLWLRRREISEQQTQDSPHVHESAVAAH